MIKVPRKSEEGFTLVELLIVIVILGILAAVVVFAVSGITDRGQSNACKTDAANLRNANETHFSQATTYGDEKTLKDSGRISTFSSLHQISLGATQTLADAATYATSETAGATGAAFAVRIATTACGTVGAVAP